MAGMILERSQHPRFLSNTYLVCDGEGGPAFFIDAGGPVGPLVQAAERLNVAPSHVLLTHHHFDHVSEVTSLRERFPDLAVLIHPLEFDLLDGHATATIEAGQTLRFGQLDVRPLHTPGHTAGMLSFLVSDTGGEASRSTADPRDLGENQTAVFTGDTLFKGSVGGVRAPGHTTYVDLRDSIMGTLMELPADTVVHPGHTDATTVEREWGMNPFIRVWRGLDLEGSEPCRALGQPATLVLLADDYDGGKKAWVRWPDGADDIVPGSQIEPAS